MLGNIIDRITRSIRYSISRSFNRAYYNGERTVENKVSKSFENRQYNHINAKNFNDIQAFAIKNNAIVYTLVHATNNTLVMDSKSGYAYTFSSEKEAKEKIFFMNKSQIDAGNQPFNYIVYTVSNTP